MINLSAHNVGAHHLRELADCAELALVSRRYLLILQIANFSPIRASSKSEILSKIWETPMLVTFSARPLLQFALPLVGIRLQNEPPRSAY